MTNLLVSCSRIALGAAAACVLAASANAAANEQIPDLYGNGTLWSVMQAAENNYQGKDFEAPVAGSPGAAGPIGAHPNHPHYGNNVPGHNSSLRIGNDESPLLLPWAAADMKRTRIAIENGATPYDPAARCWPAGVPAVITFLVAPMQFLQTPEEVTFLYQRGQVTRHVLMNQEHSKSVLPSWYGESVGHYENGDTLVVDTIGLNDQTPIDVYNIPHTKALHVIERYKLTNGGNRIQLTITIDDPGAFTQAWSVGKTLLPESGQIGEALCQVNNDDYFGQGIKPVPTAMTPDY